MLMLDSKNAELNSTHAIQERHGSSNSLRKENPPPFECSHFLCKFSVCLLNNAPILTKWIDLLKSLTILLDGKSCRSFFWSPVAELDTKGRLSCHLPARGFPEPLTPSQSTTHPQANSFLKGASLVAQWLRTYLPMQWTREDPTCCGVAKAVGNY